MENFGMSHLRAMCDDYFEYDPHEMDVGGGRTHVNINTNIFNVNKWANLALDFYKKQKKKNFNLVEVVKLNTGGTCFCMTFWAHDAVSDEHHLFRAVVCVVDEEVLLCEIKDDHAISILIDYADDYFQKLGESGEDQSSNTCKNDLGGGYVAGVILVSPTMFHMIGDNLNSYHQMCDDYLDSCLYKNCGMMTAVDIKCFDWVGKYAELTINIYNQKEQKHFGLIKVERLYSMSSPSYCMTFWARDGRSDECCLFRAVVCVKDEEDVCAQKLNESDEDLSPYT
ncbi:uncharacterized protein [Primulina eburnea]